jgi:hypothetical protein
MVMARLVAACTAASILVACSSGGTGGTDGSAAGDATTATTARPTSTRGASVARPTITGPISGGSRGAPFGAMPRQLAERYGYVEEEYFVAGEATAYTEDGAWGSDGRWAVRPSSTAPYTTRILVRRPADPAAFDGTVLVEWLNVSSGQDSEAQFAQAHEELLGHGSAWVGVSAQAVGVQGGGPAFSMPGLQAAPLRSWDPDRYGGLQHPGDQYSYDIYSQAAGALVRTGSTDPMGGLPVTWRIAGGESQSAARLVTYANAVQPVTGLFDGFLVHSRSMGGSALHPDAPPGPPFAWIRTDLDVPVLQFETEGDIFGLPFEPARQPDTPLLRTWEVAGTAHLDRGLLEYFASAAGAPPDAAVAPVTEQCGPINEGPQADVLRKAMESLRTWVVEGTPPATGEPIRVADAAIARDELGVAIGGIRTPAVDVPVVVLRGDSAAAGYVCALFGSTVPVDAATLAARYPSHEAYVTAVATAAGDAVARGHLRSVDADRIIAEAKRAAIGA